MEKGIRIILNKNTILSILGVAVILALFVFLSFITTSYKNEINVLAERGGVFGMIAYVLVTVIAVVVAPISTIPLIPVASGLWGWFVAGVLSIAGWAIGAQIAFQLARSFGKPLVAKLISLEKIARFEERLSKEHMFWTIVFLRVVIPVDVLSYAVGLFSNMKSGMYFFATLVGIAPFAFVLAYAGTLTVWLQFMVFLIVAVIFISWGASARMLSNHKYEK
ncbi:MAG: hypothetical protein COV08_02525 [Candidatus Vogelbacteria bacterium CG10_big_fil_rev_8_21_14_0_10_49_38]|uniref:TVP38/TMEM64 family membrane protein n=1 Tax=Candidatus Vogelbacteria bacterium CG10_big_fil_rev_8_21_14_0_10_49_38 TaxID=1975043 RepID=A0A2H0RIM9_9BACT|nr:MAG: hypothetical protein BK006_02540 [bacterium CG10_49_38]PIR45884.1 MAG: hypothetical protein COV08_02525 [Candidatus Vogelbacteria bacterium CG10_big_fil_rev_8_21_14_0_10_49_38]